MLSYIGGIYYVFEFWNKLKIFDLESLFLNLVIYIKWCIFFYLIDFLLMIIEMKRKLNYERFINGILIGDYIEDFGVGFVCLKVVVNIVVLVYIY